jgi:hypothetical protein
MKILTKDVKLGMTQGGAVISLIGEKYRLLLFMPVPSAFFGLASLVGSQQPRECHAEERVEDCCSDSKPAPCKDCEAEKDPRMDAHDVIKLLAANAKVEEVFINNEIHRTCGSTLSAEIKINGETKMVVPSVGVYIAKVFGAPIYFESSFAQSTDSQMVA